MFTFSNLLKRGANYLLMVLLARSVSVSVIGTYSAYVNVIGVLVLVTNFGLSEFLLVNSEDEASRRENTSNFLQISLMVFSLILIGSLVVPLSDFKLGVLILTKIYLETSIYNILLAYYQVNNKIKMMSITNIVLAGLVLIISGLLYFFNQEIYSYLIGINSIYIVAIVIHFISIRFRFSSIPEVFVFVKSRFAALKYYGITMVTIPVYMMGPTVIGSFLLPPEVLAQYQIAFSIANILLLISVSLLQVGYVKFLEYQNDFLKLTQELKVTGLKIIATNLLLFFFFILFGEDILLFVYKKEAYVQAYYPLLFLLFGNTIFMFASVAAVAMVILKLQKEKAKYHLEFIIVSVFFGFILTYYYGIYGLVSSYVILYSYSSFRYLKKYVTLYKLKVGK